MRIRWSALLVLALIVSGPARGLTPRLVKDINLDSEAGGSVPFDFVTVNRVALFVADDGETGKELWRSDGTRAGTFQLADLCPGECTGNPQLLEKLGQLYLFWVYQAGVGSELWATDGSPGNTVRLAGPFLQEGFGEGRSWLVIQGVFFFAGNDRSHGLELWRSDGTAAGTFMVKDILPGSRGSQPSEMAEFKGQLFFRATGGQVPALWKSDGTVQGTKEVWKGSSFGPSYLKATSHALFFAASPPSGLWKTDGTTPGTRPVLTSASFSAFFFAALGKYLVFVGSDPIRGEELWVSDGTPTGTRVLTKFARPNAFSGIDPSGNGFVLSRTLFGNRLVFAVNDGVHGIEPWITDGTPKGTRLLRDVCPGSCSGAASAKLFGFRTGGPAGNLFYFAGSDGSRGVEPWVTDGTAAGTRMARDLCRGNCSSNPFEFFAVGGRMFFLASGANGNQQLWRSDGTSHGTIRLTSLSQRNPFVFGVLGTALGETLLFGADDGVFGQELWRSDGTPQGTYLLADINSIGDLGGSYPFDLNSVGAAVYFLASDAQGSWLWTTDGTAAGTRQVLEISPLGVPPILGVSEGIEAAAEIGGLHILAAELNDDLRTHLWASDGTPAGTRRLTPELLRVEPFRGLHAAGNQVFFVANDDEHGEELWTTDGTPGGTRLVADLEPGPGGSEPRELTVFKGQLYFSAGNSEGLRELWRSNGTPGGTKLVKDASPSRVSEPRLLTLYGSRLFFLLHDGVNGDDLWSTDGTTAGTTLAADLSPGPDGFFATNLISGGTRLFLSGTTSDRISGLWISDGTAAGTTRISDQSPGLAAPVVFNNELYFATDRLWKSDGTSEGTVPVVDREGHTIRRPGSIRVFAGRLVLATEEQGWLYETDGTREGTLKLLELPSPAEPVRLQEDFELAPAGERLLFRRWDPATGSELWALEE